MRNFAIAQLLHTPGIEEVEPLRKLKVELNGSALDGPPEGVLDGDIDLWPIEGAIARVELPAVPEFIQAFRQLATREK